MNNHDTARRNPADMKDNLSHVNADDHDSIQDVFSVAQHNTHFSNFRNFFSDTHIQCFDSNETKSSMSALYAGPSAMPTTRDSAPSERLNPRPRLLAFSLISLIPEKNTSFGSRIAMTQSNTKELFRTLSESNENGDFLACVCTDFFCQHSRWNLYFLGAPLSIYMRYTTAFNLTTYIISHKDGDSSIRVLCDILSTVRSTARSSQRANISLRDPFDIAATLSTLSFKALKSHVHRFWRSLQFLTAGSHHGNADIIIINATARRTVHAKLHKAISSPTQVHERVADSINYVIESLQKQKIWFLNYKNIKDGTIAPVFKYDAAINLQIAADMERDSTSMNAIAAVTMASLPGTFTTILDAGILMAAENSTLIYVSGLWWLWIATTAPFTLVVVACWWWYRNQKGKVPLKPRMKADDGDIAPLPKTVRFWLAIFRMCSRDESPAVRV
ncbi:hypothetical protein BDV12DRAFT_184791 [Aspergillus spectabilis]